MTLNRPLYAAVSVVHDGIYIYNIERDCRTIKLGKHIYLDDACDAYGIIAYDGKKLLIAANSRFYLVDTRNTVEIRYTDSNRVIPWDDCFLIHESPERNTLTIPNKVLGKNTFVSRSTGIIYNIDADGKITSTEVWQEKFLLSEEKIDGIHSLVTSYLDSGCENVRHFCESRGYIFIISLDYHLGIFEKQSGIYVPKWLCTDNSIHKKHTEFGQVRTMAILDVPEYDDRWKEFQFEVGEFVKHYIFQQSIINIIASYI